MARNRETSNFCPQAHAEASSEEYVVFGVVLFLWELVPTTFVVLFFRAQRLSQNLVGRGKLLWLERLLSGGGARGARRVGADLWEGRQKSHSWPFFSFADSSRNGQQS